VADLLFRLVDGGLWFLLPSFLLRRPYHEKAESTPLLLLFLFAVLLLSPFSMMGCHFLVISGD